MSIRIMDVVFVSQVEPTWKLILLALANFANNDGENTWPSIDTIMEYTSLNERTIQRNIKRMMVKGLLIRDGRGPRGTNRYKINRSAVESYVPEVKPEAEEEGAYSHSGTTPGALDHPQGGGTESTRGGALPPVGGALSPQKGGARPPEPLINQEHINRQEPLSAGEAQSASPRRTDATKRGDYLDGMRAYQAKTPNDAAISEYPEDVKPIIQEFCRLWHLTPPRKGGRNGGEYALWISDARFLAQACGEYGLEALQRVYADWEASRDRFTVGRPGALIRTTRARVGLMRAGNDNRTNEPAGFAGIRTYMQQQEASSV